jgi:hypothetical protein
MTSNQTIAQAIDCPMMDSKNVAGIIESYCKYNILQQTEVNSVEIEVYSDVRECEEFLFVYDGQYYYMLEDAYGVSFVDGKPDNQRLIDNPERYVIIKEARCYRCWKICRRFNTFEEFHRVYKGQICKWYKIIHPDLLDDLIVSIRFMGSPIYSSTNNNGDTVELTIKQRDRIIALFNPEE